MQVSGYVPFYNNSSVVLAAVESMRTQSTTLGDIFAVDDGSSDEGPAKLERLGIRCLRQPKNRGRGAARAWAMEEAKGDLVLCCDATNVLPSDFVQRALPWFDDPKVAAVYGRIQDRNPRSFVDRWRARYLFKSEHPMQVGRGASLITYGTLVRRSAVMAVGNFNAELRHSEDTELGERLLAAGWDIVGDPSVSVYCNARNTMGQVLERYWRWYAGKEERASWVGYRRNIVLSVTGMAWRDLKAGDPLMALMSLICPHYQFWRSRLKPQ